MDNFGAVMNVRNICFKTTTGEKKYILDHAYNSGRPAVIIAEDDEFMYFLTLCGKNNASSRLNCCVELPVQYSMKESYVNVSNIYKKRICGFSELSFVEYGDMICLIDKFISYQSNIKKDELFDTVLPLIRKKLSKEEIKQY